MADPLERYRPKPNRLGRSVLDRLIDEDPDLPADPLLPVGGQITQLRENLRRDLESLLNTRCRPTTPPRDIPELADSLVSYGVEDFFSLSLVTQEQKDEVARLLERRIRSFEPRLDNLRVAVLPSRNGLERSARFRIEASVPLQPDMPPIAFESSMDPSTQHILVEVPRG